MAQAKITVHAGDVLGEVNPLIFGHNAEAADPKDIFGPLSNPIPGRTGEGLWNPETAEPVPEVLELAKQAGMKMLRYPGGCLVHNFDWKKAVGSPADRPDFTFGVDEFIAFCRAADAEPLMLVSAYVGGPQDAADLVEYLNAPATPEHPWAQRRAAWGHPDPYGVVYFEMGNESDHGNHDVKPFRKFSAEQYAEWFNECARLMKGAAPGIKMGALMGTATGPDDPWNRKVLEGVRETADFIIVHTYAVGLWGDEMAQGLPADRLMRACMAAGEQFEDELARYRGVVRRHAGRDIPLAITEYNAMFVQERPIPYRYSFGAALFSADYVRVLLKPETNVLMANYWHFINGYWGMVQGPRLPEQQPRVWRQMPAYHLYRLWGQHFGQQLVHVDVQGPQLDFEGAVQVQPASGDAGLPEGVAPDANLMAGVQLLAGQGKGYQCVVAGPGQLALEVDELTAESYALIARIAPVQPGAYTLSYTGRSEGDLAGGNFGLGLSDSRGWDATHSGNAVEGVQAAGDWTEFSGGLVTLPDCPGLLVMWRLRPGRQAASGRIEVRDIRLTPVRAFPAYAALTSSAGLSADGRTLYLIVFNKHHAADVPAEVEVEGFAIASAHAWTVTGPSLDAVNLNEELVREIESGVALEGLSPTGFRRIFPARSMTALELRRAQRP